MRVGIAAAVERKRSRNALWVPSTRPARLAHARAGAHGVPLVFVGFARPAIALPTGRVVRAAARLLSVTCDLLLGPS
jgi:hypothetical protein